MAKAKTEGQWTSRTLAEWNQSQSVIWRAQISTAPDGKEFAGVRKYIRKADGSEIADRSGISLLYDAGTLGESVDALIDLLQKLKGGKVRLSSVTGAKTTDKGPFVIEQRGSKKFLVRAKRIEGQLKLKTTEVLAEAMVFATYQEAEDYGDKTVFKIKGGWQIQPLKGLTQLALSKPKVKKGAK